MLLPMISENLRCQGNTSWPFGRRNRAEPAVAADRAGVTAFREVKPLRPAPLLNFIVRRGSEGTTVSINERSRIAMKHISIGGLDVSRIGLGAMSMSAFYNIAERDD